MKANQPLGFVPLERARAYYAAQHCDRREAIEECKLAVRKYADWASESVDKNVAEWIHGAARSIDQKGSMTPPR